MWVTMHHGTSVVFQRYCINDDEPLNLEGWREGRGQEEGSRKLAGNYKIWQLRPKEFFSFWSLCVSPQTSTSAFLIFFFFAMKRCPIAVRIAGSIRILPFCALNDFFHVRVWTFASLSHHTLYMGNLVPAYTMYHVLPCWQKKRWPKKKGKKREKSTSRHQFWSRPTTRNRRLFLFFALWTSANCNFSYLWLQMSQCSIIHFKPLYPLLVDILFEKACKAPKALVAHAGHILPQGAEKV